MPPSVLLLDHYDSFTHILRHTLQAAIGTAPILRRCDALSLEEALEIGRHGLVLSPGPGAPGARGIGLALVHAALERSIPLLGICLGQQLMVKALGGAVRPAAHPVHGRACAVHHAGTAPLRDLPNPFQAMRYHSLQTQRCELPDALEPLAWLRDEPETVMGVVHRSRPALGLQFHPESFLTPLGPKLLADIWRFLQSMRTVA